VGPAVRRSFSWAPRYLAERMLTTSLIPLMAITLRTTSEFSTAELRPIDHGINHRGDGWVMLTITKSSFANRPDNALALSAKASEDEGLKATACGDRGAIRPELFDSTLRGNVGRTVLQLSAVAVIVFAMNCVASLAAPSHSMLIAQSEVTSQASMVDRARKGDRLNSVGLAIRAAPPPGCDSPFSSLVKLSPSNFIGRCLP